MVVFEYSFCLFASNKTGLCHRRGAVFTTQREAATLYIVISETLRDEEVALSLFSISSDFYVPQVSNVTINTYSIC